MVHKVNMTIIGGSRGLGRWIAEHLREDFNITITSRNKQSGQKVAHELDVNYNDDNIDAIKNAEIIVFSVAFYRKQGIIMPSNQLYKWRFPQCLKSPRTPSFPRS